MTARSLTRLVMSALWLIGGIVLWIGIQTEAGVTWQSYPGSIICILMVAYNLLLAWYYASKRKPTPETNDVF